MDKYMTLDDVIKEFRTKITCDKDFDMFTEEEKNKLEDRLSEIDRLTLQAKARLLNLKNEVSNGR